MAVVVDHSLCLDMALHVESLTTSGSPTLNSETMKKFKNICKKSDEYVKHAYHLIITQLGKEHAEIRLSCMLMIDELFMRSHCFRELLLDEFNNFMVLAIETDPDYPLPPPKSAAKALRQKSLFAVAKWQEKFGSTYKKLTLAYNFLRDCKKVQFRDLENQSNAERAANEQRQIRLEKIRQDKIKMIEKDINEKREEMKQSLIELENVMKLLMPEPDEFQIPGFMSPAPHSMMSPKPYGLMTPSRYGIRGQESSHLTSPSSQVHTMVMEAEDDPFEHWGSDSEENSVKLVSSSQSSDNVPCKVEEALQRNDINNSSPTKDVNTSPNTSSPKQPFVKKLTMPDRTSSEESILPNISSKNSLPKSPSTSLSKTVSKSSSKTSKSSSKSSRKSLPESSTISGTSSSAKSSKSSLKSSLKSSSESSSKSSSKSSTKSATKNSSQSSKSSMKSSSKPSSKSSSKLNSIFSSNPPSSSSSKSLSIPSSKSSSSNFDIDGSVNGYDEVIKKDHKMKQNEDPNTESDGEFHEISDNEESEGEEEFEYDEDSFVSSNQQPDHIRELGFGSQKFSIEIPIQHGPLIIEETNDNTELMDTFHDLKLVITKNYLPVVNKWLETLAKFQGDQGLVKKALDIKAALAKSQEKIKEVDFKRKRRKPATKYEDDEDDDDDFEDVVEKDGYEDDVPENLKHESGMMASIAIKKAATNLHKEKCKVDSERSKDWLPIPYTQEDDPTSWLSSFKRMKEGLSNGTPKLSTAEEPTPSTSRSSNPLKQEAPVVPFGNDLMHWGTTDHVPLKVNYFQEHRFWTPSGDKDIVDEEALASMKSRVMTFTGKFEPVKRSCRAPMKNGTLCQRMDRIKCPFHGKIIPRNVMGEPTDAKDIERLAAEEEKKRRKISDLEDEELQREISEATGIDLVSKKSKKKKGKKKKYPNLTDINAHKKTGRNRLERKVLSQKALSRVGLKLDDAAKRRARDKFGNQFNYTYTK